MIESFQAVNAEFPWFFASAAFLFGAIVGSFLNVCIYRIPANKSIVHPGSTCACGQPIAWSDNIPILSWFFLRGKARCCGQAYSFRYPAVEALTGALFLAAWLAHEPAKAACIMVFISMLICGSFIDLDHMELPNRFTIGLAIVGFALSVASPSLHQDGSTEYFLPLRFIAASDAMLGALIGSGLILWIALLAETALRKDAMGFGDVKLLGGIGTFLGWQGAVFSIFGGALLGTLGLIVFLALKPFVPALRKQAEGDEADKQLLGRAIPFGPMLSGGALLYTLLLERQVDMYFDLYLLRLFDKIPQ